MTDTVLSGWRFRALLLIVLVSALGYLAFSLWGGWHEVVSAIVRVGFIGTAIALSLSLVNYGLRFVRWQKFLALLGHHVYAPESLRIYIAGFAAALGLAAAGVVGTAIAAHAAVSVKKHKNSETGEKL